MALALGEISRMASPFHKITLLTLAPAPMLNCDF